MVWIERNLFRFAAEYGICDADHLLAGYRREETAEKGLRHLKNLITAEGNQRLSRLVSAHLKLLLEKVEPGEVVKSLELAKSFEDLPEDLLLVACELLVEDRCGLVSIAHGASPGSVPNHLLAELLLQGLDILLDHAERDRRIAGTVHLLADVTSGVVMIRVGKYLVDDAVSLESVFVYWHSLHVFCCCKGIPYERTLCSQIYGI